MKFIFLISAIYFSLNLFGQNEPNISIFQANLLELSNAFEKRDYQTIDKMLHHKQVSEEMMKKEVEFAINDSILPLKAINFIDKIGQFGSLKSVFKNEIYYKRYLEKAKVDPKDCYGYFYEKNGIDILVFAEWQGTYFLFIKIRNLKELLN
jgi:hypothetical protein